MRRFGLMAALFLGTSGFVFGPNCNETSIIRLVDKAVAIVEKDGNKAFAEFMKDEFKLCDSHIWVHEYASNIMTFHTTPSMIGKVMSSLKDPDNKMIFEVFKSITGRKGAAGWVQYKWAKPGSSAPSVKCAYVKRADDNYVVGFEAYSTCAELGVKSFK